MKRIFVITIGCLLVAIAWTGIWAVALDFDFPAPTGPHAVGRAQFETGGSRNVAMTLYYPAQHGTGSKGPYMPPTIASSVAARDLGGFAHMSDPWSRVNHHLHDEAAWAEGRFPLIVFSPGADVQPQYYSTMLAELVSHGFVVVALSHPGLTPFIAYSDGSVASSVDPIMPSSPEEAIRQHEERIELVASDIGTVIRSLESSSRLGTHLTESVAAFGHSLGGAGAASAAARDPEILAVGDMDGSLGAAARNVSFARPVLFMTDEGSVAPSDQAARAAFVKSGAPGLKVTLHGASHMTFATDTNFFQEKIPFADEDSLGAREALEDITKPLREFFTSALAE